METFIACITKQKIIGISRFSTIVAGFTLQALPRSSASSLHQPHGIFQARRMSTVAAVVTRYEGLCFTVPVFVFGTQTETANCARWDLWRRKGMDFSDWDLVEFPLFLNDEQIQGLLDSLVEFFLEGRIGHKSVFFSNGLFNLLQQGTLSGDHQNTLLDHSPQIHGSRHMALRIAVHVWIPVGGQTLVNDLYDLTRPDCFVESLHCLFSTEMVEILHVRANSLITRALFLTLYSSDPCKEKLSVLFVFTCKDFLIAVIQQRLFAAVILVELGTSLKSWHAAARQSKEGIVLSPVNRSKNRAIFMQTTLGAIIRGGGCAVPLQESCYHC